MKRQILLKFFIFIMALSLFTACGQKEETKKDSVAAQPTTLVYGYIDAYSFMDFDSEIKKEIVDFNTSQSEYYIEIKQYGEDDYAAGLALLNAELAAGKGPDIIQIDMDAQYNEYAAKDMIVDLYSFMSEGSKIQKEDFFENVLTQFEVDGKLYGLVPFFSIFSAVGNPNLVNEEIVTLDDISQRMEAKEEEDITIFEPLSKEQVLYYCCFPELDAFVDWENKTCDFTGEDFIRVLDFSNQFDYQNVENNSTYDMYIRMHENKVAMVVDSSIASFDDYTKYKSLFDADGLLIGWPTVHGSGPQINSSFPYLTINTNSVEKEAAWEFLSGFCESDFLLTQDNVRKGFPIVKEAFDLRAEEAMEVTMGTDANGNPVEIPDEYGISDRSGQTIMYPVYAATEEQVEYLRTVIENLEATPDYGDVSSIIFEEVADYWSGSKSAEEVAEVIQNRVSNYLSEIS